jgi:hypothetical protein
MSGHPNFNVVAPHPDGPTARPRTRCPDGLAIVRMADGDGLYATRRFAAGEPVFEFKQVTWLAEPGFRTVAHPGGRYFFDPMLAMVARTRDPNCRIALDLMVMIARRDIAKGERITFSGGLKPHR